MHVIPSNHVSYANRYHPEALMTGANWSLAVASHR